MKVKASFIFIYHLSWQTVVSSLSHFVLNSVLWAMTNFLYVFMYTSNNKVSLEYSCWNLLGESEYIF